MKTFEMSNNEGVQKVMNKVVLFIVEGALDREFFGYYFSELIENKNLEIYVTNGDILTKFTRNPERLIEKHFNSALKKSKFLKEILNELFIFAILMEVVLMNIK